MHPVFLKLAPVDRLILEHLSLIAAQVPGTALANPSLNDDAQSVFRVTKEVLLNADRAWLSTDDVVKTLRFAVWVLSSPGVDKKDLKPWIAEIVMQMQIQDSGFELILRAYGVDRKLAVESGDADLRPATASARLTTTLNQTRIRLTPEGAELASQTLTQTRSVEKK